MPDDDPLKHADVGETVHIERERVAPLDPPLVYRGSDRLATPTVSELEVTDDGDLRIVWEANVTKTLPRNWEYCRDPLTDEEKQRARRSAWRHRAVSAAAFFIPTTIAAGVAAFTTSQLSGELTINGEPMTTTTIELLMMVVPIIAVTAIIFYGIQGGFPRVRGGVHR